MNLSFLLIIFGGIFYCASATKVDLEIYKEMSIIPDTSHPNYKLKRMIGPGKYYNQGRQFFDDGQYVKSIQILGNLLKYYPDFFKNDFASLFISYSYERLGFKNISDQLLKAHIKNFQKSPSINYIDRIELSNAIRHNLASVDSLWHRCHLDSNMQYYAIKFLYYDVAEHYLQTNEPVKALSIYKELNEAGYFEKTIEKDILLAELLISKGYELKFRRKTNPFNTKEYYNLGSVVLTTLQMPHDNETFEKLKIILPSLEQYLQFEIDEMKRWRIEKKHTLKLLK